MDLELQALSFPSSKGSTQESKTNRIVTIELAQAVRFISLRNISIRFPLCAHKSRENGNLT